MKKVFIGVLILILIVVSVIFFWFSRNSLQTGTSEKFIKSGAYTYLDEPGRYYIDKVDLNLITDWDVVLPEELDGIPMSTFFTDDFEGNDKITSLTIPASYTAIFGSFKNCKNLKKVVVEGSYLYFLNEGTFAGCENLEEVVLKQDIDIRRNVFENCKNLKTITGPGKIKGISVQAFKGCENLERFDTEVVSNCNIADEAFYNCVKFNKSTLPSDAVYGDNVFGTDDNTYIIEKSSTEKIDMSIGKGMSISNFEYSKRELELAKNEIFARYGHDFDNKELAEYFAGQKWYNKVVGKKVIYDDLNNVEKYNVDILDKYIGITKEMENGNGSSIYFEDGTVYVFFMENKQPKGENISIKYEYINNGISKKGNVNIVQYSTNAENIISRGVFRISTSLKDMLDKNVKLSCYIDGKLYTEKTVYIDKLCEDIDFYNELIIKSDNSFTVKSWTNTFKAVDRNGKELKLFNITQDRIPLNTSFFGDKFIADDGYLYSFNRYDDKNVDGHNVYCDRISDKKIVSYSLDITDITTPDSEFNDYDISITYEYEDGTNYTEKLDYIYYSV
jgi:hypothetical protein